METSPALYRVRGGVFLELRGRAEGMSDGAVLAPLSCAGADVLRQRRTRHTTRPGSFCTAPMCRRAPATRRVMHGHRKCQQSVPISGWPPTYLLSPHTRHAHLSPLGKCCRGRPDEDAAERRGSRRCWISRRSQRTRRTFCRVPRRRAAQEGELLCYTQDRRGRPNEIADRDSWQCLTQGKQSSSIRVPVCQRAQGKAAIARR